MEKKNLKKVHQKTKKRIKLLIPPLVPLILWF